MLKHSELVAGYLVLDKYVSGPKGIVYRAKASDGRDVHLRTPSEALAAQPGGQDLFARQATAPTQIDDSGLLRVLDTREPEDSPGLHIIERPAQYQRLLSVITSAEEPMTIDQVFPLLRATARVLDAARQHGFVCCDVNTSCILFRVDPTTTDPLGITEDIKLLSNFHPSDQPLPSEYGAKPPDQYALASIAYLALTSRLAEKSDDRGYRPAPASSYIRSLPTALDGPLMATLRRETDSKYATCTEFVGAMEEIVQQWKVSGGFDP